MTTSSNQENLMDFESLNKAKPDSCNTPYGVENGICVKCKLYLEKSKLVVPRAGICSECNEQPLKGTKLNRKLKIQNAPKNGKFPPMALPGDRVMCICTFQTNIANIASHQVGCTMCHPIVEGSQGEVAKNIR